MRARHRLFALVLVTTTTLGLYAGDVPKGMEDVFKVEKGKPYHPFWPPVSGQDLVGTIVVAKSPSKPEAFFETIESPDYRNVGYTGTFELGSLSIQGGTFGQTRNLSGNVAFSQLDGVSNGIKCGPKSSSLLASGQTNPCDGSSSTQLNSGAGTQLDPSQSGTSQSAGSQSSPSQAATSQGAPSQQDNPQRTVTGADFQRFNSAKLTIPKLHVTFYTLKTLRAMENKGPGGALSTLGLQTLSSEQKGWIVSRCLIADAMTYELTSDTAIDAGFFAKLLAWLPTASVRYKNDHTVAITTTSPVVLGYKLWRPGVGPQSSSVKVADVSIGADEIDAVLNGKQ